MRADSVQFRMSADSVQFRSSQMQQRFASQWNRPELYSESNTNVHVCDTYVIHMRTFFEDNMLVMQTDASVMRITTILRLLGD